MNQIQIKFILSLTLLSMAVGCSNNSKTTPKSENNEETISPLENICKTAFEFVQATYPVEFDHYAQNHNNGDTTFHFEEDLDSNSYLLGNIDFYPLISAGELYKIDMNNDGNEEYLCLLGLSPGISWHQHLLLFNNNGEILDTVDIKTKEGVCHVFFKHLQNAETHNLVCEWQQSLSLQEKAGLFIYKFDGSKLNMCVNETIEWIADKTTYRGPDNPTNICAYNKEFSFVASQTEGVEAIEFKESDSLFNGEVVNNIYQMSWEQNAFKKLKVVVSEN